MHRQCCNCMFRINRISLRVSYSTTNVFCLHFNRSINLTTRKRQPPVRPKSIYYSFSRMKPFYFRLIFFTNAYYIYFTFEFSAFLRPFSFLCVSCGQPEPSRHRRHQSTYIQSAVICRPGLPMPDKGNTGNTANERRK